MSGRPNFYLLLDLAPEVDDWAVIEARIVEKQRAWSLDRNQGNPRAKRRAERALELLPQIRALLADPEPRREEAKQARRQQQEESQQRRQELGEAIALIRASGPTFTVEQEKRLTKVFGQQFTADEIRRELAAAGLKPEGEASAPARQRKSREQIDPVTAKSLATNLEAIEVASLYEFLGLSPRSSPQALMERAEEVYRELHRRGATDAHGTASKAVAGLARTIFATEIEKARYDAHLDLKALEQLKPNLELAGDDKALGPEEVDRLVLQARKLGVNAEDALAFIEDYATSRKWKLAGQEKELAAARLKLCGYCSTLAAPEASHCPQCGEALDIACPGCGDRVSTFHAACERCGLRIGDGPLVKALVREGERQAREGDAEAALKSFEQALHYWPRWEPAAEGRQKATATLERRRSDLDEITGLARQRRFVAAHALAEPFSRRPGGALPRDLAETLRNGLERARAAYESGEAERKRGNSDAAFEHFEETIAACADFEPALRRMATSPPAAPTELRVVALPEGFRLGWKTPAGQRSTSYRVVRKAGGAPSGPEDGVRVAEVRTTQADDAPVPAGTAWYYAVYSLRGPVASDAAALSGPHLRTEEVSDLEAVALDREVRLSWSPPPGCLRVEVWRREGLPPGRPGEGVSLAVSGGGAQDTGLVNGMVYAYLVVAVYAHPAMAGREVASAGRTITARPQAPPAAVTDLLAKRNGREVLLSWTPLAHAAVQIRQSASSPGEAPGALLALARADRLGSLVPSFGSGQARALITEPGRVVFVPLSVAGDTAVVGKEVELSLLEPVSRLEARRSGSRIALTWEWPSGVDQVRIAWARERAPAQPGENGAGQAKLSRQEYDRQGCWMLPYAEPGRWCFSVFAEAAQGELFAPPAQVVESGGELVTINYRVAARRGLFSRAVVEARIELTGPREDLTLPALLVVGKAGNVPVGPQDGELLAEVSALRLEKGKGEIALPERSLRSQAFVKLFFRDPSEGTALRLLPAARKELQVL